MTSRPWIGAVVSGLVFSRTANGNVAPSRWIGGAATLLGFLNYGIGLDLTTNLVWVVDASGSAVRGFTRTSSGNVAPSKSITGASTGLSTPTGFAFNSTAGEMMVRNSATLVMRSFLTSDTGNVAPQRSFTAATGTYRMAPYYCQ